MSGESVRPSARRPDLPRHLRRFARRRSSSRYWRARAISREGTRSPGRAGRGEEVRQRSRASSAPGLGARMSERTALRELKRWGRMRAFRAASRASVMDGENARERCSGQNRRAGEPSRKGSEERGPQPGQGVAAHCQPVPETGLQHRQQATRATTAACPRRGGRQFPHIPRPRRGPRPRTRRSSGSPGPRSRQSQGSHWAMSPAWSRARTGRGH